MLVDERLMRRYQDVVDACTCRLTGHRPLGLREQLNEIGRLTETWPEPDRYGEGELIESFEAEIAELLGKPAAVFLVSGTMAQCIALRVWADRAGKRSVGFHATSHLELHEQHAYRELYGLESMLIGSPDRAISADDLGTLATPPAALLLELPMREIGGQLPTWDDLEAQRAWATHHGVALHMDGARLWQCGPYYQRELSEIAGLFDSVYVSFYKDMGGIAGSVLAGPVEFIAEARQWIRRAGGNLFSLFPYVLAARAGVERNLASMPRAVDNARWLSEFFGQNLELPTTPVQPPTNLFHLPLAIPANILVEKAITWSEQNGVFLAPAPHRGEPDAPILEFSMGGAVEEQPRAQWERWLTEFYSSL